MVQFEMGFLNVSVRPVAGFFSVSSDSLTDGIVMLTYADGAGGLNLDLSNGLNFVLDVLSSDLGGVLISVMLPTDRALRLLSQALRWGRNYWNCRWRL